MVWYGMRIWNPSIFDVLPTELNQRWCREINLPRGNLDQSRSSVVWRILSPLQERTNGAEDGANWSVMQCSCHVTTIL